jgi:hypothetical protein
MGALNGGRPLLMAKRIRSGGDGHLATTARSGLMHRGSSSFER